MNTSVRFLIVLALGAMCLSAWTEPLDFVSFTPGVRPATASAPVVGGAACDVERTALRDRLAEIFAKQQASGDIRFQGSDSVFYYHPLLATFVLESCRGSIDPAFLQQAHGALKSYFNYLLVHHDTDGDFLVERGSSPAEAAADFEDVGFNAMLALDMSSLSAICLELKMPIDALFWYQGVHTISKRLVAASFDPDADFFFPTRANSRRRESLYFGLSALPIYFSRELGDNISRSVARNYLLKEQALLPETPSHYLTGQFTANELAVTDETTRSVRTLLLRGALERNGFHGDIAPRQPVESTIDHASAASPSADVLGRCVRCILSSAEPPAPFPEYLDLDILDGLVFQKSLLDPSGTAELRRALADVHRFLTTPSPSGNDSSAADTETITAAIRQVYFGISTLRQKWNDKTLFDRGTTPIVPGFDVYSAISSLWDDVIVTLQEAEDLATHRRLSSDGVDFTATLLKDAAAPGEPIPIRFDVSTLSKPVAIRSLVVLTDQGADTLLNANPPLEISASDTLHGFPYSYSTIRAPELTVHPFVISAELRFADESPPARRHFNKGVFITKPVTFVVKFPNGMSLGEGTIPVEIHVTKNRSFASLIHAQWFSPVGLKPLEGSAVEARMPAHADELTLVLNIPVPTPCRPGSFPFTLRVSSNGQEVGTVSSRLFKHYKWLYIGPFAETIEGLGGRYAPESPINLMQSYPGAHGQVRWRPLGERTYADEGQIVLDRLLPTGSVGFLYTVIETAAEKTTTVYFGATSPSHLYVNGDPLFRIDPSEQVPLKHARVVLKQGMNDVMIKTISREKPVVFFQLGDEEDLASDEFNNNLWELVDGYAEVVNRATEQPGGAGDTGSQTQRQITFKYSDPEANSVSVVGSFNGWSPSNSNMRKNKRGEWEISLYLTPGRYPYRFLVNNNIEVLDPKSAAQEPDGYGGHNSILNVE